MIGIDSTTTTYRMIGWYKPPAASTQKEVEFHGSIRIDRSGEFSGTTHDDIGEARISGHLVRRSISFTITRPRRRGTRPRQARQRMFYEMRGDGTIFEGKYSLDKVRRIESKAGLVLIKSENLD